VPVRVWLGANFGFGEAAFKCAFRGHDVRDGMTVNQCLTQLVQNLSGFPSIERIILFGSRARGDHSARSDIDLAIDCPQATRQDWTTMLNLVENANTLLSIDCIKLDEAEPRLQQNILQQGEVLYSRKRVNAMDPLDTRWQESLLQLGNVLNKLDSILQEPENATDYILDATIQRYEFVFELYWKTLKHLLALEGLETASPRDILKKAYQLGLIQDDQLWLEMMVDRNLTSHTYKEALAREVYARIKQYLPTLKATYQSLVGKYPV